MRVRAEALRSLQLLKELLIVPCGSEFGLYRIYLNQQTLNQDVWSLGLVWGTECSEEEGYPKERDFGTESTARDATEAGETFTKSDG